MTIYLYSRDSAFAELSHMHNSSYDDLFVFIIMKTNNITILSVILVIVTFIQIFYFLTNDSEIRKENVKYIISLRSNKVLLSILSFIILLFCVILVFYISCFIERQTRVNKYAIFAFIAITITNYAEYKLKTNVHFSDEEKEIDVALEESKTGDFILCRSYNSHDISAFILMRYAVSMFSTTFFSHIGMIVKDGNETYIVENTEDVFDCMYHKYRKNGPIIQKAKKRIKEYSGRVYLSKTNLHQFIDSSQLYENFKKYEHYSYLQDGIVCMNLISNMLSDLGVMVRPSVSYLICDFIYPQNYKVDFTHFESIKLRNDFLDANGI